MAVLRTAVWRAFGKLERFVNFFFFDIAVAELGVFLHWEKVWRLHSPAAMKAAFRRRALTSLLRVIFIQNSWRQSRFVTFLDWIG